MTHEASTLSSVTSSNWTRDVKSIAMDSIKIEVPDPGRWTFNQEAAERLAVSIQTDGLLCPPIVEDLQTGQYKVLAGRHRVHACDKILGWQEITCLVLTEPDPDLVESIDLTTNVLSHPLDNSQKRWAIERLYQHYKKSNPPSSKKGRWPHGEGFAQELKRLFQFSEGYAHRVAATAQFIKPEAREALEGVGATQTNIDQIAALGDPDAIAMAVEVTQTGVAPIEAIRQGKKVKADKKAASPPKPIKDGAMPAKAEAPLKAADLTDDKWLEQYCGKVLNALPKKSSFRRDAILYRRIADRTVAYRTGTKKALMEAKKPSDNGAFFANVWRVVRASHPMNWLICDGCNGNGHMADDKSKQCGRCLGGGYKVKYEET